MKFNALILGGTIALTVPVAAQAATVVPPAAYGVYIGGIGESPGPVGTTSATPVSTSYVFAPYGAPYRSFSATTASLPNATSTVSLQDSGYSTPYDFATGASINYYFAVTGPSDVPVPIIYNGNISISGNAPNDAPVGVSARDGIFGYSDPTGVSNLCGTFLVCSLSGFSAGSYPIDESLTIPTNTTEEVYVLAYMFETGYLGSGLPAFNETLTVDPFIQIDPTWLSSNPGYSLEFSSGVGNSPLSAAPEPATWAMMLVGLGGIGAAMRSSRRKMWGAAAAAA